MAIPQIIYSNLSSITFSGSAGTNASYPLSNLQDYSTTTQWKSNNAGLAGQYLQMDLGNASTSCSALVVDNHNFYEVQASTVSLDYSDNASSWTTLISALSVTNGDPIIFFYIYSVSS